MNLNKHRLPFQTLVSVLGVFLWIVSFVGHAAEFNLNFSDLTADWEGRAVIQAGFLSHNSNVIFILTGDGKVILYDRITRTYSEDQFTESAREPIRLLAWSPDGDRLAYVNKNDLFIYDYKSQKRKRIYDVSGIIGPTIVWRNADEIIFSLKGKIHRINASNGKILNVWKGGWYAVETFSRNSNNLYLSDPGDFSKGSRLFRVRVNESNYEKVTLLFDSRMIGEVGYAVNQDETLAIFVGPSFNQSHYGLFLLELKSGNRHALTSDADWSDHAVAFSPDSNGVLLLSIRADRNESGTTIDGLKISRFHVRYSPFSKK